jgi:hypothetical protein
MPYQYPTLTAVHAGPTRTRYLINAPKRAQKMQTSLAHLQVQVNGQTPFSASIFGWFKIPLKEQEYSYGFLVQTLVCQPVAPESAQVR